MRCEWFEGCDQPATWQGESICGCSKRSVCDAHHDRIVRDLTSTTYKSSCFRCGTRAADADIVASWARITDALNGVTAGTDQ